MSSSFVSVGTTDLENVGFWSNDGFLGIWLVALANAVSDDDQPWLTRAAERWRLHGVQQFMGCMDAGLDCLTSPDRVTAVTEVAIRARASLVAIAEDGYIRPPWLVNNQLAEENGTDSYHRYGVKLNLVLQIADAFIDLLGGQITTTAATSPVFPISDDSAASRHTTSAVHTNSRPRSSRFVAWMWGRGRGRRRY